MVVKTKTFLSDTFSPATTPDGSSLEEKVNAFLATVATKDVRNVETYVTQGGRFGMNFGYHAVVTYTV